MFKQLRFRPSERALEGILEARVWSVCPQKGILVGENDLMAEDCLNLNIATSYRRNTS